MSEGHVRQGRHVVNGVALACREAQIPRAHWGYAPPAVVKMRLDNIVRGATGTKIDSSSQTPVKG